MYDKDKLFTSVGQRKLLESLTGIEPMASQIPVAMGSILVGDSEFFFCPTLVDNLSLSFIYRASNLPSLIYYT